jgi:hypothetical protein
MSQRGSWRRRLPGAGNVAADEVLEPIALPRPQGSAPAGTGAEKAALFWREVDPQAEHPRCVPVLDAVAPRRPSIELQRECRCCGRWLRAAAATRRAPDRAPAAAAAAQRRFIFCSPAPRPPRSASVPFGRLGDDFGLQSRIGELSRLRTRSKYGGFSRTGRNFGTFGGILELSRFTKCLPPQSREGFGSGEPRALSCNDPARCGRKSARGSIVLYGCRPA